MKVNQWTLGLAAAGAIAFGAVCSSMASNDPPAQMAASVSQTEVIAKDTNTLAENTSLPRISAVASKNDANGMIAGFDTGTLVGKEVAFTGPQLAAGVISFGSVAYTHHTATDAHKMHVLAIPISVPAIAAV